MRGCLMGSFFNMSWSPINQDLWLHCMLLMRNRKRYHGNEIVVLIVDAGPIALPAAGDPLVNF